MVTRPKPVVLLVEDEELLRLIVAEELREAGYEVMEAMNGGDALDVLGQGGQVDLLFTDIRMPGELSGWDVAERARSICPDLPVIYATGYFEDEPGIVPGGRFFKKPYRASSIIDAARELGVSPAA